MSRTSIRLAMLVFQVLAAIVFLAGTASSQGADSVPVRQTNSLRAGAWALQFAMGQKINLTSFDGATISIKKHTSDRGAWRLGVTLSGDAQQAKSAYSSSQGALHQEMATRGESNTQSLNLSLTRIVYPRAPSAVNVFCGIGPRLSYNHTHSEVKSPTVDTSTRTSRGWTAGVGGVLGVEWFPYRSIGLSGEYGLAVVYRWQKDENSSVSSSNGARSDYETTLRGFSLLNGLVRLGISVYW